MVTPPWNPYFNSTRREAGGLATLPSGTRQAPRHAAQHQPRDPFPAHNGRPQDQSAGTLSGTAEGAEPIKEPPFKRQHSPDNPAPGTTAAPMSPPPLPRWDSSAITAGRPDSEHVPERASSVLAAAPAWPPSQLDHSSSNHPSVNRPSSNHPSVNRPSSNHPSFNSPSTSKPTTYHDGVPDGRAHGGPPLQPPWSPYTSALPSQTPLSSTNSLALDTVGPHLFSDGSNLGKGRDRGPSTGMPAGAPVIQAAALVSTDMDRTGPGVADRWFLQEHWSRVGQGPHAYDSARGAREGHAHDSVPTGGASPAGVQPARATESMAAWADMKQAARLPKTYASMTGPVSATPMNCGIPLRLGAEDLFAGGAGGRMMASPDTSGAYNMGRLWFTGDAATSMAVSARERGGLAGASSSTGASATSQLESYISRYQSLSDDTKNTTGAPPLPTPRPHLVEPSGTMAGRPTDTNGIPRGMPRDAGLSNGWHAAPRHASPAPPLRAHMHTAPPSPVTMWPSSSPTTTTAATSSSSSWPLSSFLSGSPHSSSRSSSVAETSCTPSSTTSGVSDASTANAAHLAGPTEPSPGALLGATSGIVPDWGMRAGNHAREPHSSVRSLPGAVAASSNMQHGLAAGHSGGPTHAGNASSPVSADPQAERCERERSAHTATWGDRAAQPNCFLGGLASRHEGVSWAGASSEAPAETFAGASTSQVARRLSIPVASASSGGSGMGAGPSSLRDAHDGLHDPMHQAVCLTAQDHAHDHAQALMHRQVYDGTHGQAHAHGKQHDGQDHVHGDGQGQVHGDGQGQVRYNGQDHVHGDGQGQVHDGTPRHVHDEELEVSRFGLSRGFYGRDPGLAAPDATAVPGVGGPAGSRSGVEASPAGHDSWRLASVFANGVGSAPAKGEQGLVGSSVRRDTGHGVRNHSTMASGQGGPGTRGVTISGEDVFSARGGIELPTFSLPSPAVVPSADAGQGAWMSDHSLWLGPAGASASGGHEDTRAHVTGQLLGDDGWRGKQGAGMGMSHMAASSRHNPSDTTSDTSSSSSSGHGDATTSSSSSFLLTSPSTPASSRCKQDAPSVNGSEDVSLPSPALSSFPPRVHSGRSRANPTAPEDQSMGFDHTDDDAAYPRPLPESSLFASGTWRAADPPPHEVPGRGSVLHKDQGSRGMPSRGQALPPPVMTGNDRPDSRPGMDAAGSMSGQGATDWARAAILQELAAELRKGMAEAMRGSGLMAREPGGVATARMGRGRHVVASSDAGPTRLYSWRHGMRAWRRRQYNKRWDGDHEDEHGLEEEEEALEDAGKELKSGSEELEEDMDLQADSGGSWASGGTWQRKERNRHHHRHLVSHDRWAGRAASASRVPGASSALRRVPEFAALQGRGMSCSTLFGDPGLDYHVSSRRARVGVRGGRLLLRRMEALRGARQAGTSLDAAGGSSASDSDLASGSDLDWLVHASGSDGSGAVMDVREGDDAASSVVSPSSMRSGLRQLARFTGAVGVRGHVTETSTSDVTGGSGHSALSSDVDIGPLLQEHPVMDPNVPLTPHDGDKSGIRGEAGGWAGELVSLASHAATGDSSESALGGSPALVGDGEGLLQRHRPWKAGIHSIHRSSFRAGHAAVDPAAALFCPRCSHCHRHGASVSLTTTAGQGRLWPPRPRVRVIPLHRRMGWRRHRWASREERVAGRDVTGASSHEMHEGDEGTRTREGGQAVLCPEQAPHGVDSSFDCGPAMGSGSWQGEGTIPPLDAAAPPRQDTTNAADAVNGPMGVHGPIVSQMSAAATLENAGPAAAEEIGCERCPTPAAVARPGTLEDVPRAVAGGALDGCLAAVQEALAVMMTRAERRSGEVSGADASNTVPRDPPGAVDPPPCADAVTGVSGKETVLTMSAGASAGLYDQEKDEPLVVWPKRDVATFLEAVQLLPGAGNGANGDDDSGFSHGSADAGEENERRERGAEGGSVQLSSLPAPRHATPGESHTAASERPLPPPPPPPVPRTFSLDAVMASDAAGPLRTSVHSDTREELHDTTRSVHADRFEPVDSTSRSAHAAANGVPGLVPQSAFVPAARMAMLVPSYGDLVGRAGMVSSRAPETVHEHGHGGADGSDAGRGVDEHAEDGRGDADGHGDGHEDPARGASCGMPSPAGAGTRAPAAIASEGRASRSSTKSSSGWDSSCSEGSYSAGAQSENTMWARDAGREGALEQLPHPSPCVPVSGGTMRDGCVPCRVADASKLQPNIAASASARHLDSSSRHHGPDYTRTSHGLVGMGKGPNFSARAPAVPSPGSSTSNKVLKKMRKIRNTNSPGGANHNASQASRASSSSHGLRATPAGTQVELADDRARVMHRGSLKVAGGSSRLADSSKKVARHSPHRPHAGLVLHTVNAAITSKGSYRRSSKHGSSRGSHGETSRRREAKSLGLGDAIVAGRGHRPLSAGRPAEPLVSLPGQWPSGLSPSFIPTTFVQDGRSSMVDTPLQGGSRVPALGHARDSSPPVRMRTRVALPAHVGDGRNMGTAADAAMLSLDQSRTGWQHLGSTYGLTPPVGEVRAAAVPVVGSDGRSIHVQASPRVAEAKLHAKITASHIREKYPQLFGVMQAGAHVLPVTAQNPGRTYTAGESSLSSARSRVAREPAWLVEGSDSFPHGLSRTNDRHVGTSAAGSVADLNGTSAWESTIFFRTIRSREPEVNTELGISGLVKGADY